MSSNSICLNWGTYRGNAHGVIINPSASPWSCPVVIVPKKGRSKKLCVTYSKLNNCTVKHSYPLPCIDDILGSLAGVRYISTIDLKSGYCQITMSPEDK